jgi:endo-1,4-beta-xylanase
MTTNHAMGILLRSCSLLFTLAAHAAEPWRDAARARIAEHRQANFDITVVDAHGTPVPNASVTVKMMRHSFGFGALMNITRWDDKPNAADARRHLALAAERFNKIVVIPQADDAATDRALDWLAAREIRVRGHYLMWAPLQPGRERRGQPPEAFTRPVAQIVAEPTAEDRARIRAAAFAHLERMLRFAGNRIAEWDAINHLANDAHPRFSDLFGAQIFADVIQRGRELAPHAQMWVNEGNVLTAGSRYEKYHAALAELIALGAKPDGVGFMAHFREGELTPPEEIYRRLERFAALVPNLQLTELDIDVRDEGLQAETMRDVLEIAFSHPAVSGIVMWQVWGQAAGAKALWRADWSIKPAGQVWLDHVFKDWWTETDGATDRDGRFAPRGFLGDYEITVTAGDRRATVKTRLVRGGTSLRVTL